MRNALKPVAATVFSAHEIVGADHLLYRFLVESLLDYAVFAISPSGVVLTWNAGAEQIFGYAQAEIVGQSFAAIFTAEDASAGAPLYELTTAQNGEKTQHDRWHVRKDGTRFWGTNTVRPLHNASGRLLGFTKLVRDTTASHLAFQRLDDSEEQLRLVLESVHDCAIFTLALDGTITSWNAGAEKMFGHVQAEILGADFSVLFSCEDATSGVPSGEIRMAAKNGHASVERWLTRKDGSQFLSSGKLSRLKPNAAGELRGFVRITHDITEQHAAVQDLRRRAHYDELTELPNRRTFYEHVERAIAAIKRRPTNLFAVLFIDLDHFKNVNDRFGHLVADELLAVTARRLEACIRSEDIVARIGGDEFAILLNGISGVSDAYDAVLRMKREMQQPALIEHRDVRATASVGIAIGSGAYDRPEDILRDADSAMYRAKGEGRARAMLFHPSLVDPPLTNASLSSQIQRAIERNEFFIAYQPVARLCDSAIVGFEALIRWQHPERGQLVPKQFIPAAQESDLIFAIDRWMIDQASEQLASWQKSGIGKRLAVSVNISIKEFTREAFLSEVRDSLTRSGLDAAQLRLDITESAAIERSERTNNLVHAIRSLGVALDLDDFGTGYSSLDALQHLSLDGLKIDASFVAGLHSASGVVVVETMVGLAHKLGIVAIAEGIETARQRETLVALGCDYGQGYAFAPALDADAARLLVGSAAR